MECTETRLLLLDHARGLLAPEVASALQAHLASCPACHVEDQGDRALTRLLEQRLPRPTAPAALRRTLGVTDNGRDELLPRARSSRAWLSRAAVALAAALALLIWQRRPGREAMVAEAVNDHLRVLYTEHPLDVESGGIHQVKPWFEGRLEFAPVVPFAGDEEFVLRGGATAYFIDRKAAAFIFKRHLHVMTLLVFRAEGLPWPLASSVPARVTPWTERGFHVLLWRSADLGYALVSDVDDEQMTRLADRLVGGL